MSDRTLPSSFPDYCFLLLTETTSKGISRTKNNVAEAVTKPLRAALLLLLLLAKQLLQEPEPKCALLLPAGHICIFLRGHLVLFGSFELVLHFVWVAGRSGAVGCCWSDCWSACEDETYQSMRENL